MIYISCPICQYTGGPTLAHQLCKLLNDRHIDAKMFYVDKNKTSIDPVHPFYKVFGNPYVTELKRDTSETLIVLETKSHLITQYPNAKKYIWWQSVDNFFISHFSLFQRLLKRMGFYPISLKKEIKTFKRKYPEICADESIIHLVQSEYARLFLRAVGVDESRIFQLTDYIEDEVFENSKNKVVSQRDNIVLYNPRKGYKFTKLIIEASRGKNIVFKPLVNMSKDEVTDNLCRSKLYIDFGNHPGKDRFPREAAICGCCIMTGRRGAADNSTDIAIPDNYKIKDDKKNIPLILDTIDSIMKDYDRRKSDFDNYRSVILKEKEVFEKEVESLFIKTK